MIRLNKQEQTRKSPMKQVVYQGLLPNLRDRVAIIEVPTPEIADDEVLVDVKMRPINPADLLLIQERHVFDPTVGTVIGIEGAGIVSKVGKNAKLTIGQQVAIPFGGTWQEQMKFKSDLLLPFSDQISLEQGSMLAVNPVTAYCLLMGLEKGQSILLNAANSAISKIIIRMAKLKSLNVIAVVRRESAVAEVKAVGADLVIVDRSDILLENQVKQLAKDQKIMRAFDAIAGQATKSLFHCIADGGELIVYGLLSDTEAILPAAQLVFRNVTVKGFSRLRYLQQISSEEKKEMMDLILSLFEKGFLETKIEKIFDLSDVKQAIEAHENPNRSAKILLSSI